MSEWGEVVFYMGQKDRMWAKNDENRGKTGANKINVAFF